MNLLIFLDKNQLSFFKEENNKVTLISDNYLYFHIEKSTRKISHNIKYKIFTIEKTPFFYDDILDKFLNEESIDVEKEQINPADILTTVLDNELTNSIFENTYISYSSNLKDDLIKKLTSFFNEKFQNLTVIENFTSLAVKNYLKSNQISSEQSNIFILSASNGDIFTSQAHFSGSSIDVSQKNAIKNIAFYPYGYELAKNIYQNIQRIYKPNSSQNAEKNIKFIYCRLFDKAEAILNQPKSQVTVSARLLDNKERFILNIKPEEIKISAKVFLKSFVEKLLKEAKIPQDARLILIGDYFNNELIFSEIKENFKNTSKAEFASIFETREAEFTPEVDEYSTMFLEEDDNASQDDGVKLKQVNTLDINELQIGVQVKLSNYDARKGKGHSTQILEFLGDSKFVVVESSRSLKTGDIAITETNIWHQGIKVVFKIQRSGKDYGRFQSREIQTIEVSE